MSTAELLQEGDMTRIDGSRGAALRVLRGKVWLTRYNDLEDHVVSSGATVMLGDAGPAVVTALAPTLLERYRTDATALRREIEGRARRDRTALMWHCLRRLFA